MILLQALPDANYFVWQLYIQMLNFREIGIEKDAVILVGVKPGMHASAAFKKFEEFTHARVYYFEDTRVDPKYASSIRPHLIKKYFEMVERPSVFYYHDQDIIFTKKPNFEELAAGDICYCAHTSQNYMSAVYCRSFKPYIFPTMCEIVGISQQVVIDNDPVCGGAQNVIKGVGADFWEKVEKDSEALFRYMHFVNKHGIQEYKPDEQLPAYHIQEWTADMWAVQWNLWLFGKKTGYHPDVEFSWPWEMKTDNKTVIHNAGIDGTNEYDIWYDVFDLESNKAFIDITHDNIEGVLAKNPGFTALETRRNQRWFNKSRYNGDHLPFGMNFSFVGEDRVQHEYIKLLHRFHKDCRLMEKNEKKEPTKILGIFCTHNKINPELLALTLDKIKTAANYTNHEDELVNGKVEVEIVVCSWLPVPDCPFENMITHFRDQGHLNYILQLKQVLLAKQADMVCILEHDVIYPHNYFSKTFTEWDYGKYGIWNNNYIGMNHTGYLDVKERHQPFSLLSVAKFYLEKVLDEKINVCVKQHWCCIEPDNKADFKILPFTDVFPCIHVNMNTLGEYHTGHEGKNHHFTNHCEVCYDAESGGKVNRPDWGDFKQYFTFMPV